MEHLTEAIYAKLVRGELPPAEARAWARHLEASCERCEAFLATRPEPDALDARADRALSALGAPGAPGNDLEFRRIERRLAGAEPEDDRAGPGPAARPRRLPRPALAAAAGVLVAGLAGAWLAIRSPERPGPPEWTGEKGAGAAAAAIPVRLRFLVVEGAGGAAGPDVEKGVPGQAVPAAAKLQFEVELGRAAQVALLRTAPGQAPEVFFRAALPAGRTVITLDGRPAAYPLAGLAGPQRFLAIASAAPLDDAGAARAAERLGAGRPGAAEPGLEGLSVDAVDVAVQ